MHAAAGAYADYHEISRMLTLSPQNVDLTKMKVASKKLRDLSEQISGVPHLSELSRHGSALIEGLERWRNETLKPWESELEFRQ